jgi:hypothetical protein
MVRVRHGVGGADRVRSADPGAGEGVVCEGVSEMAEASEAGVQHEARPALPRLDPWGRILTISMPSMARLCIL